MKWTLTPAFIIDSLWQPLVLVRPGYKGLLVQPGSTMPPVELAQGWQWHWPLLTTVRLISLQPHLYTINATISANATTMGDEPVVAVTKDHQLVSIEGQLSLQVKDTVPLLLLATLNQHSINRVIRPVIRQSIRLAVADYRLADIHPSDELNQHITQLLNSAFASQAITLKDVFIVSITPFNPLVPNSLATP